MNSSGIVGTQGISISGSNVKIECGNIKDTAEFDVKVNGMYAGSQFISISKSNVSIVLGSIEAAGNSMSKGFDCNDPYAVNIRNGSYVEVSSGDIVVTGNFKAISRGADRISVISDSTLVSRSGNVSTDSTECESTGIYFYNNLTIFGKIENSTVYGAAGKTKSCNQEGEYYGIRNLTQEIVNSSVRADGLTAGFKDPVTSTGHLLIIGSKSVENPAYEIIEGGITEEVAKEYKILRIVLGDEINDVTYDLDGGTGPVPETETHIALLTFIVKPCEATKDGYKFAGWTDGVNVYQPGDEVVMPYGPVTLTAVWEEVPGPGPEPEPERPSEGMSVPLLVLLCVTVVALILIGTYRDDRKNE